MKPQASGRPGTRTPSARLGCRLSVGAALFGVVATTPTIVSQPARPAAWALAPAAASAAAAAPRPITVPAEALARSYWVADALMRNGGGATEFVFYEELLQTLYAENPTLPATSAVSLIAQLRSQVATAGKARVAGPANQAAPEMLDVVRGVLATGSWDARLVEAVRVTFQYFASTAAESNPDGYDQVVGSLDLVPGSQLLGSIGGDILRGSIGLARDGKHAGFAAAHARLFAGQTATTTATAKQIAAAHPSMRALSGFTNRIDVKGRLTVTRTDLDSAIAAQLGTLSGVVSADTTALATLASAQKDIPHAAASPDPAAKKAAGQQASAGDKTVKSAEGALDAFTYFLGLDNKEYAKEVKALGKAAIEVAKAVNEFLTTAKDLGSISNMVSLAGAAATGNVIGAIISLVNVFGDQQQDPNTKILNQLAALRQDLAKLGEQLGERFDQVDRALNKVYSEMMGQFALIDLKLGRIDGNVVDILGDLHSLQAQLLGLQGGLWTALDAGFRRPLWDEIDYALGYHRRTGKSLPPADFLKADSKFYTWATIDAYDDASVPNAGRSFDLSRVAEELAAYPLDSQADYLNGLAAALGVGQLTTSAVPSPHDWYLAARAYAELAERYPTLAQANKALGPEIGAIITGGTNLQKLERGVTSGTVGWSPRTGAESVNLPSLYAALLAAYDSARNDLGTAIDRQKTAWRSQHDMIDPWGTVDQPLTKQIDRDQDTCAAVKALQRPPSGDRAHLTDGTWSKLVPSYVQLEERYHGTGASSVCVTASWDGPYVHEGPRVTTTGWKPVYTVFSNWTPNGGPAQRLATIGDSGETLWFCSERNDDPNPPQCDGPPSIGTYLDHNWNSIVAQWDTKAADFAPGVSQQLRDSGAAYLRAQRQQQLRYVATQAPTEEMHGALARLTGVVAALRAYSRLGMSAAYDSDEVLQAMLDGTGRLYDDDGEQRILRLYAAQAAADDPVDPWNGLDADMTAREVALAKAVANDVRLIRWGWPQSPVELKTTLDRLRTLQPAVTTPGLAAGPVTIPATKVGTRRAVRVTISNPGLGALSISKATINGAGLRVTGQTCTSVPGHGTCAINISYSPRSAGSTKATLTMITNTVRRAVPVPVTATAKR